MDTIYLDLDGTILDVHQRYWRLHKYLARQLGLPPLNRYSYWQLKRRGARLGDMYTRCSAPLIDAYIQAWTALIEDPLFLTWDRVLPNVMSTLVRLANTHRLVLVTLRRNRETLFHQLNELDLLPFFSSILHRTGGGGKQEKHHLIQEDPLFMQHSSWVVGDTEADVLAGIHLGIPSVGVLSGLRNREYLRTLGPTYLITTLANLPALLKRANSRIDRPYRTATT